MALDERLQLGDELAPRPELEVGVDPLLERVQPQLLEPADLALREALELEIGERRPAPERERLARAASTARPRAGFRASATSRSKRTASTWSGSTWST